MTPNRGALGLHQANLERLEALLLNVVQTAVAGPVQRLSSQQAYTYGICSYGLL